MPGQFVIAVYKYHDGQEQAFLKLLKSHEPTLREQGLVSDHPFLILKAENNHILEIFEWLEEGAAGKAHSNPAVTKLWEEMGAIADFPALESLSEVKTRFPHFQGLSLDAV